MKRNRFSEEQLVATQAWEAGVATAEACRRYGARSATFCQWNAKIGDLEMPDAKRLRQREDQNSKLQRPLAEALPDNAMLREITSGNGSARREAGSGGSGLGAWTS